MGTRTGRPAASAGNTPHKLAAIEPANPNKNEAKVRLWATVVAYAFPVYVC